MAECLNPFYVKSNNDEIPVPCGKCPNCAKRRASAWSFRLMQEAKSSINAHFITLTYDTAKVPITRNGYMEIKKRDLQLFFKRLRKASPRSISIKYYAVGEYGGRTKRPHYHLILYNAKLELIQPAWNLGNVHYGKLEEASVGYTLKYISKPRQIPMHRNDDRQPEFSLMSKGLGANYLTPQMVKYHKADINERMYCTLADGKKVSMPRYYKDKIYNEHERLTAGSHQRKKMLEKEAENIKKYGVNKWEEMKEHSKAAHFTRAKHNNNSSTDKL